MTIAPNLVLAVTLFVSLGLFIYAWVVLPREVENRLQDSLRVFGRAVELRCPAMEAVTARVRPLSRAIASELRLSAHDRRDLEMAVSLRDIGMCALPYSLLNKPRFDWNEAEQATFWRHAQISGAMVELVPSLRHLSVTLRCHHSRFDRPVDDGLPSGAEIPINARIIAVASAFVSNLRHKGLDAALADLDEGTGAAYDPTIVLALKTVLTSDRAGELQPLIAA